MWNICNYLSNRILRLLNFRCWKWLLKIFLRRKFPSKWRPLLTALPAIANNSQQLSRWLLHNSQLSSQQSRTFASVGSGAGQSPIGCLLKQEICQNWNKNWCTFTKCRYRHVCRVCFGPRLEVKCWERVLGMTGGCLSAGRPPHDIPRPY